MKSVLTVLFSACALLLSALSIHASESTPKPYAAKPGKQTSASPSVTPGKSPTPAKRENIAAFFHSEKTVIWANRPAVIPFSIPTKAKKDRHPEFKLTDVEGTLRILSLPVVLGGESGGWLRVSPLKTGTASLKLGGDELKIEIKEPRSEAAAFHQAQVLGPVEGATLWGTFAAAVEITLPSYARITPDAGAATLTLKKGKHKRTFTAKRCEQIHHAPNYRYIFKVDGSQLPNGWHQSTFQIKSGSYQWKSEAVHWHLIAPKPEQLISGECEMMKKEWPRPKRARPKLPATFEDPNASGGLAVMHTANRPSWVLPVEVLDPGQYQFMMRVRGTPSKASYPTIGILPNNQNKPLTTTRILDKYWHRIAVGYPIYLKAGKHVLSVEFLNDLNIKKVDRNAFFDIYEIVRVQSDSPPTHPTGLTDPQALGTFEIPTFEDKDKSKRLLNHHQTFRKRMPPKVAFENLLHDKEFSGAVTAKARVWRHGVNRKRAPITFLILNEKKAQQQQSLRPLYDLTSSNLKPGQNTLQLMSVYPDGERAWSDIQKIQYSGHGENPVISDRQTYRFWAVDSRWDPSTRKLWQDLHGKVDAVIALSGNIEIKLSLPQGLSGKYKLIVNARAQEFRGPPSLSAKVVGDGLKIDAGWKHLRGWYQDNDFGVIDLPRDSSSKDRHLLLKFNNDLYEKGRGDRNIWIHNVTLVPVTEQSEESTAKNLDPQIAILHPSSNEKVGASDAVVVSAEKTSDVHWVDIQVDGQHLGLKTPIKGKANPLVIPLSLKYLSPGKHKIEVIYAKSDKVKWTSPAVEVVIDHQYKESRYARAIHLLQRLGYGPEKESLASILLEGEDKWLRQAFTVDPDSLPEKVIRSRGLSEYPLPRHNGHLKARVVQHSLLSPKPAGVRLLAFVENHFSTWARKAQMPREMAEHLAFARLGPAPFQEHLLTSATSPAMMIYLDQQRSYAGRLNENYAREIMELHTLGIHGGYQQDDVTNLAKVLTGWTLTKEANPDGAGGDLMDYHRFDPVLSFPSPLRLLGMRFGSVPPAQRYDRAMVLIERLVSHPSTANFLSTKIAAHYTSNPPDEKLVNDLSQEWLSSGGDLQAVLEKLVTHEKFQPGTVKPRLTTPRDYAVRLSRLANHDNPWHAMNFLTKAGTGVYDRETPDGFPEEDQAYADSNALLQRWHYVRQLEWNLYQFVPHGWRYLPKKEEDRRAHLQRIIDQVAVELTGRHLKKRSNEAALQVGMSIDPKHANNLRQLAVFICQLPEVNLR